jgi:4-hydroxy-3-methylbut-2-enyl diphosphate reductase
MPRRPPGRLLGPRRAQVGAGHGPPREMLFLDATCPLVSKVHVEAERHHAAGRHILLIGHAGHPEVVGTMGQLPEGAITLIETVEDAETFQRPGEMPLAYATQTTLSMDDTAEILKTLKARFPELPDPHKEDICYATTNRQEAVKVLANGCDLVLVVGSPNSSNSVRLVEVALRGGAKDARLVDDASQVDWRWFDGVNTVGVTAGASAPEPLIQALIAAIGERFDTTMINDPGERETVTFKLPRALTA